MPGRRRQPRSAQFAQALATHYDGTTELPAEHLFEVWNEVNNSLVPRSGQCEQLPRDGQRGRERRARRRSCECRRGRRARPVRAPEEQEAEVVLGSAARLHALAALPLEGIASARDLPQRRPLRRLVASPVHVRRRLRACEEPGRRRARRPAEDAVAAAGGRAAPSRRLDATGPVLGDGVRLGHESAAAACRPARPRVPVDGRVALPDVAFGSLAPHVVRPAGSAEPEPVPERPLLPLARLSTTRGRSRCSRPSASRSSRTSHGSTVSVWGRDATSDKERVAIQLRHGKSGSWRTVAYVVSNGSGIFRATLKLHATKKDWLRAVRARLRQVARLLAHGAEGSPHRPLGLTRHS